MVYASLIIPTCNRPDDLRRCLEAILPQLPDDGRVEVIVTDDGTDEAAQSIVKTTLPQSVWRRGPCCGPASNRNSAAREAKGKWLIFLDDDCVPEFSFVAAYLEAMRCEEDTSVAFEGKTIRATDPESLLWEAPHNPNGGSLISCNFAIRKKRFLELKGFDERYPGAAFEDTEFALRFRLSGGRIVFLNRAMVVHPLRSVPSAQKLAKRWEARVIFAFDQGASAFTVAWRLPWHTLRVIQSRFRNQSWSTENARAAWLFFREWLLVLSKTPAWVRKWAPAPRSFFWSTNRGNVPKFGF